MKIDKLQKFQSIYDISYLWIIIWASYMIGKGHMFFTWYNEHITKRIVVTQMIADIGFVVLLLILYLESQYKLRKDTREKR